MRFGKEILHLKKQTVFLTALVWFSLSFILIPIWNLESSSMKWLYLGVTIFLAWLWAWKAASDVVIRLSYKELLWLVIILLLGIIYNYPYVTSVIPWKGDEDYHIVATNQFLEVFRNPLMLSLPLGMFILLVINRHASKLIFPSLLLFMALCCFLAGFFPIDQVMVGRYPGINRLFTLPMIYLADVLGVFPREWMYRLVPLLATVWIAWLTSRYYPKNKPILRLLMIAVIFTIPVVSFYSSILYLELPMILLMTIVCFSAKDLIRYPLKQLRNQPGWYALIAIGFLRESALPFLVAFMSARYILRLYHHKLKIPRNLLFQEIVIGFCVMLPVVLQIFFVSHYGISRPYTPVVANLFNGPIMGMVFSSYWESLAWMLLPFIAGCIFLYRRKQWPELLMIVFFVILNYMFWTMDSLSFWGLARFNLMLVPVLLLGSVRGLQALDEKIENAGFLFLALILIGNIFMTPLNLDGTKKNLWGVFTTDAEYYYPYRQAIHYLSESHPNDKVMLTGMQHDYDYRYYQEKFQGPENIDFIAITQLERAIMWAELHGFDVILFQAGEREIAGSEHESAFELTASFENNAGKLLIYSILK